MRLKSGNNKQGTIGHAGLRPKKEEALNSFADDEVARLRESMNAAADECQRANSEKQPAMANLTTFTSSYGDVTKVRV